jgi:hypothetical protein
MADEVIHTEEERPRDTVVVEREGPRANTGLIILAVIVILLLIFFLVGNPFGNGTDTTPDVNVDVPAPTVNTPTPSPTE